MVSRATRTLVDIVGLVGIAWMWIAIYESFTRTGLWRVISDAVGGAPSLASQAAVLASCVMTGWVSVALTAWVVWFVCLRGRVASDFPVARLV